jgi:cytochrome c2
MKLLLQFSSLAFIVIAAQSCRNTSEITTDENGLAKTDIGEGKVVFMRDCTRCHGEKKVENFTSAQWSNILPRMIIQAELNDDESRQVKAYVEWELDND